MLFRLKRLLLGQPLHTEPALHHKLPNWKAFGIFSSNLLSSVAYATEELLIPLALFSVMATQWSIPISLAIISLLLILTLSYRRTIEAYPGGGAAYTVATDNLGKYPGLLAGASQLLEFTLTVAVSVTAAVMAVTAMFPWFILHQEGLAFSFLIALTFLKLRGVRPARMLFALPAYFFLIAMAVLIAFGGLRIWQGQNPIVEAAMPVGLPEIPLFLLLRSFSAGCVALSGMEAIPSSVEYFQTPSTRNAKRTLALSAVLLAGLFASLTVLAHFYGTGALYGETVISNLSRQIFDDHWVVYFIALSTVLILLMAANRAYGGFPVLASLLAKDRYLPRQLASLGDRLVFSNGILGQSIVALLLILAFDVDLHRLVALYAVAVFLTFSLSQLGMIRRHLSGDKPGRTKGLILNSLGAAVSMIVFLVIAVARFTDGAWVVFVFLPLMMFMFMRIHAHYITMGKELSIEGVSPTPLHPLKHTVIIPISGIHRGVLDALRYAVSISNDVRACYVELDPRATERIQEDWKRWASDIPFVVLKSPYRSVITPVLEYINDVEQITHDDMITVIIPEFVTTQWWHRLLHNQTAWMIRAALAYKRNKVVTSVRYHLREK